MPLTSGDLSRSLDQLQVETCMGEKVCQYYQDLEKYSRLKSFFEQTLIYWYLLASCVTFGCNTRSYCWPVDNVWTRFPWTHVLKESSWRFFFRLKLFSSRLQKRAIGDFPRRIASFRTSNRRLSSRIHVSCTGVQRVLLVTSCLVGRRLYFRSVSIWDGPPTGFQASQISLRSVSWPDVVKDDQTRLCLSSLLAQVLWMCYCSLLVPLFV